MKQKESLIDPTETIEFLKNLVRINSVNPSLVNGAPGEAEIAEFVAEFLMRIGLETQLTQVDKSRPNVVGVLRGKGGGNSLVLSGHLDTVGVKYMKIDPFNPLVKEGKLYGRGSNDMKGGIAAILSAAKAVVESGVELRGDLIVAFVVDEEYASIGMERLVRDVRADAAVVAEPTQLQIVVAHKGFVWIDIETKGVAAHGSKPELGVDAIAKMGKVLVELERIQEAELAKKRHTLVGAPSIHASTISGGRELSTYPDHCILQVERRIIPGENIDTVKAKFNSILNKISREDPKFTGSLSITFAREPMEVSTDEKICRVIQQSALEVTGIKPKYVGEDWWMDTQILWEKGIPAVAFGPTGNGSHSAIEYVITDSVIETARILERTAINFCV